MSALYTRQVFVSQDGNDAGVREYAEALGKQYGFVRYLNITYCIIFMLLLARGGAGEAVRLRQVPQQSDAAPSLPKPTLNPKP